MNRNFKFKYCVFGSQVGPKVAPEPSVEVMTKLIGIFQDQLKKPIEAARRVIQPKGSPCLVVELKPFGQSALLAHWAWDSNTADTIFALSLFLSGDNPQEDDKAWFQAKQELLTHINGDHNLIKLRIAKIGENPRPLAATIFWSLADAEDTATQYATQALAQAFYG